MRKRSQMRFGICMKLSSRSSRSRNSISDSIKNLLIGTSGPSEKSPFRSGEELILRRETRLEQFDL
jgi:hypothetical protein